MIAALRCDQSGVQRILPIFVLCFSQIHTKNRAAEIFDMHKNTHATHKANTIKVYTQQNTKFNRVVVARVLHKLSSLRSRSRITIVSSSRRVFKHFTQQIRAQRRSRTSRPRVCVWFIVLPICWAHALLHARGTVRWTRSNERASYNSYPLGDVSRSYRGGTLLSCCPKRCAFVPLREKKCAHERTCFAHTRRTQPQSAGG